jgi:hypothetical protein
LRNVRNICRGLFRESCDSSFGSGFDSSAGGVVSSSITSAVVAVGVSSCAIDSRGRDKKQITISHVYPLDRRITCLSSAAVWCMIATFLVGQAWGICPHSNTAARGIVDGGRKVRRLAMENDCAGDADRKTLLWLLCTANIGFGPRSR